MVLIDPAPSRMTVFKRVSLHPSTYWVYIPSTVSLPRQLAVAQAVVLALLATGLGSLLGLVVGVPGALMSTANDGVEPVVALPWLGCLLFVIVVPLVAGLVAAVSTRTTRATPSGPLR